MCAFNIFKKKEISIDLLMDYENRFVEVLSNLKKILFQTNNPAQSNVVEETILLLTYQKWEDFVQMLNSASYWGGSGAVWEVHIENSDEQKYFRTLIIDLIELMEISKIRRRRIKSIKNLFR